MRLELTRGSLEDRIRYVLGGLVLGLSGSLIILATPRTGKPVEESAPPVFVSAPPAVNPARPSPSPGAALPGTIADLRRRDLLVPVEGIGRAKLVDSFTQLRDRIREHEAIDIMAPRGTPVLAVESGTIAKLFTSVRGGLTIYQFDRTETYAYYYAHLDRYQVGLREEDRVERGQVIGFVGTTGNASKNTPHLHFSIFLMTPQKHWWEGTTINPYDVWRNE